MTTSSSSKTSSPLATFDPFATHPFTNYSAPNPLNAPHPTVPQPSSYASYQRNAQLASIPKSSQPPSASPSSSKSHTTRPVSVPFQQEASSPELSELLKKQPPLFQAVKK